MNPWPATPWPADGKPCGRCGQVHPRGCTGHRSSDGGPCRKMPIRGGKVCEVHGGSASQVRAAADRRLAEVDARRAMATYGLPVDVEPVEALLEEICHQEPRLRGADYRERR